MTAALLILSAVVGVGKSLVFCDPDTNTVTMVNSTCINEVDMTLYFESGLGGLSRFCSQFLC